MPKIKSVLVTGGSGFLGINVVGQLLENGFRVWSMDLHGKKISLPSIVDNPKFKGLEFDILDPNLADNLPDEIDCVVHLAGLTNVTESIKNPLKYEKVNVEGTIRLLDVCKSKMVNRFIFSSSAAVYGIQTEDEVDESHLMEPVNPYGLSKSSAEKHVLVLCKNYGIDAIILRLFNLYGLNQPVHQEGIIPTFIKAALADGIITIFGSGDRTRSFIHVKDAAKAFVRSCLIDEVTENIVNICGSKPISVVKLANMIIQMASNTSANIEYIESSAKPVTRSHCDGKLARELLDFIPEVNFEDGLRELIIKLRGQSKEVSVKSYAKHDRAGVADSIQKPDN